MAVLIECPRCHRKLSTKSKVCSTKQRQGCNLDLEKAKRAGSVVYWIAYRLPHEKTPRWEKIVDDKGKSKLDDAIAAMGKRKAQKTEGTLKKILDIKKPQDEITFQQLTTWYLEKGFQKVHRGKVNKHPEVFEKSIEKFNIKFGNMVVSQVTAADVQQYQNERTLSKKSPATIDQEIGAAKAVVNKAFLARKVTQDAVLEFKQVPRLLIKGSNIRNVTVSREHYSEIYKVIADRSKSVWKILSYEGMREGEVLCLTLNKISLDRHLIKLGSEDTKEKKEKIVPMDEEVYSLISARVKELESQGAASDTRLFDLTKDQFIYDVRKAHQITGLPYGRFNSEGVTSHALRHTWKTDAVRANVSKAHRKALQGHSTDEMDERYTHLDDKDLISAMKQITDFRNGKLEIRDDNPTLLKAILEKLGEIQKNVNKTLTNSGSKEKEVSDYVS